MSALSAMQEKTQHLENSLSAETRIKLDLFSALGDARRQLEIAQGLERRPLSSLPPSLILSGAVLSITVALNIVRVLLPVRISLTI